MKKLKQLLLWTMMLCCLFSFTAFAYPAALPLPALTGKQSVDVARIAESQLGYREDSSGITVYGTWWGQPAGDWCAMFACWCANQAGAGSGISYNSASAKVGNLYNFLNQYGTTDNTFTKTPQCGDFIFFSNSKGLAHVAVITDYNSSTREITYVGGNQGNYSVTKEKCLWTSGYYTNNSQWVYGFGRPHYPQNDYPTVPTFSNSSLPVAATVGKALDIQGTITSRTDITSVYFNLYDSSGTEKWQYYAAPMSGKYDINYCSSSFQYAELEPGIYRFCCKATNGYGEHIIFNYSLMILGNKPTVENGIYNIVLSSNPNVNVTIQGNTNDNGGNVWMDYTSTTDNYDKWRIEYVADGFYKVINVGSGRVLEVNDWGTANGTNIVQYDYLNHANQLWYLFSDGANGYYFIPQHAPQKCMDAYGGSDAAGTNIWLYDLNYSNAQRWKLTGGCTHTVIRVMSEKAPTCTANGCTQHYYCTKCYKYFADQALKNEITKESTVIKATGHKWNSTYTVDKKATCDANGSKSIHCSACNGIKANSSKAIEKTGHKYGSSTIVKATFTKNGSSTRKCSSCGSKKVTTILKVETPKLSTTKYTYNGLSKKPTVTVTNTNGKVLKAGTDYTLSYASGRKSVGRYGVTVKLTGNYSGSKTVYFTIAPKAPSSAKAVLNENYDQVKLTWSKSTGASGYSVYYRNASVSNSKFVLTGRTPKTQYTMFDLDSGSKYEFKIVPYYKTIVSSKTTYYESAKSIQKSVYTLKKLNTPTLSKSGTKVKVKWNNISGETGYQISRSTTKTGTNIVSTYATTSGTYKTVTATKGKAYYYKVRAYKTVDGKKVYGPWSTAVKYVR